MDKGEMYDRRLCNATMVPDTKRVAFTFEGEAYQGYEGETLAAALTASGILGLRQTKDGALGGIFVEWGCVTIALCRSMDDERNAPA